MSIYAFLSHKEEILIIEVVLQCSYFDQKVKQKNMGQASTSEENYIVHLHQRQWKPHPSEKDIFYHQKSKLQVRRLMARLTEKEKEMLRKRLRDHHPYIIRIMYFESLPAKNDQLSHEYDFNIYAERVFKVLKKDWKPIETTLCVLKGFRRLSSSYGTFKINQNMIGVNGQSQVRLWIHQNPINIQPQAWVSSEKQMIQTLGKIVAYFDPQTALLLAGAESFNQCINNILVDMSKKSSLSSQRHDFTKKKGNCGVYQQNKSSHQGLRKKRIKPFIENFLKESSNSHHFFKKPLGFQNLSIKTEGLSKSTPGNAKKQGAFDSPNQTKQFLNENEEENEKCLPQESYSIYGKNYNKKKTKGRNRHSSNDLTGENSNSDFAARFQTQNVDHFYYSKSPSPRQMNNEDQNLHEKTEQKLGFPHKINNPLKEIPQHQKKNVQFQNPKLLINMKRFQAKKNHKKLNQNSESPGKDFKLKKFLEINMKKVIEDPLQEKQDRKSEQNSQKQRQSTKEDNSQRSHQFSKQDFSKKLKKQFGELLSLPQEQKSILSNTSTQKDLMIKQKINRKKQTFAELKKEALKLLGNQLVL